MYFFVMGAKGSGKTTVAKALKTVLENSFQKKRLKIDNVYYHHFPTNPPPDNFSEKNLHLHFLQDFESVGYKLYNKKQDGAGGESIFIYDRSFVSTCIHQGLEGDRPELIPHIIRQGLYSLAGHDVSYSYPSDRERRVCFLLVETDGKSSGGSGKRFGREGKADKWRPNHKTHKELKSRFKQIYDYLKVQLPSDQRMLPDNLSPMFMRFLNSHVKTSSQDEVQEQMEKRVRDMILPAFEYDTRFGLRDTGQKIVGVEKERVNYS